ncbi:MAG: hypothetical protein CMI02_20055 [Oceanospirillaceae bacterium]|nr:hypothetical protein [Oceanospirillaceae bacterium]MBT14323.1 hypothetical protein [Oceanospirillaceae bacterium]
MKSLIFVWGGDMTAVQLNDNLLIARGRDRACYRHPENPALCIKVSLHTEKQTSRERLYSSYMVRKAADLSMIAQYLFSVETNLGEGAVYPLVYNGDGHIAPTLTEVIRTNKSNDEELSRHLLMLKQYLRHNRICVRDLSPNNVVCVFHGQRLLKLVVVDGVINPGINPLNIRIPFLIRRSQRKSWKSFRAKIDGLKQEEKSLLKDLKSAA